MNARPACANAPWLLVALLVVGWGQSARADHLDYQLGARELHDACKPELAHYCKAETLTVQPQVNCLREYYLSLSISCRIALKHRAAQTPKTS